MCALHHVRLQATFSEGNMTFSAIICDYAKNYGGKKFELIIAYYSPQNGPIRKVNGFEKFYKPLVS